MFTKRTSDAQATESRAAPAPPKAAKPAPRAGEPQRSNLMQAKALLQRIIDARIDKSTASRIPRGDIAAEIKRIVTDVQQRGRLSLNVLEARDLVTLLVNEAVGSSTGAPAENQSSGQPCGSAPGTGAQTSGPQQLTETGTAEYAVPTASNSSTIEDAKAIVQPLLLERIDVSAAADLPRAELARQIGEIVAEIRDEQKLRFNLSEQRDLVTTLINDMLGLGPLEPLLSDESITDIMVNGPNQVYIERKGKLERTNVQFRDNAHVLNIASRIVNAIGRRVDESSPLVDARLEDGSRVNIIIPPLAIDGLSISIRKFAKKGITLDIMAKQANVSEDMATVLKIGARAP